MDPANSKGQGGQSKADRAAMVEKLRRQQESAERRRNLAFIGVASVLGVGLIAAAAVPVYLNSRNDPANQAVASFGVPAADAGCSDVASQTATGTQIHVDTGTLEYETVPPSFGPHRTMWTDFGVSFYGPDEAPEVEQLVHNLEHGYNVVWYDETVAADDAQLEALRGLSEAIPASEVTDGQVSKAKFKVAPWDDAYGELPEGMHLGITHWGADEGFVQHCAAVSGAAIDSFVVAHPYTDSPEPNAQ